MLDHCLEESHMQVQEKEEKKEAKDSDDQSDFEGYVDIVGEKAEEKSLPLNLTDCLLGLRSENKARFVASLQPAAQIIKRASQNEVRPLLAEMLDELFLMSDQFGMVDFEARQEASIVEMVVKVPSQALDIVLRRLRSKECGIGERIRIIKMIGICADRLAEIERQERIKEEENQKEKELDKVKYLYVEEIEGAEQFRKLQLSEEKKNERIKEKTRIFASASRAPPTGFQNRFLKHSDKFIYATLYHVSQPDFVKFLSLLQNVEAEADILMSEYVLSSLLKTFSKFIKHSQNALNIKDKLVAIWRFAHTCFESAIAGQSKQPGRQIFEIQIGLLSLLVEIRNALKPHLLEAYPEELEELSQECEAALNSLRLHSIHDNVMKVASALSF